MPRYGLAIGVALVGAIAGPLLASEPTTPDCTEVGLGPLRLGSQSPGQSLRLGLVPRTPSNLPAGAVEIYTGGTWVNVWADKDAYHLDYEALSSEVSLTYGLSRDWQLEGGIITRTTFGGHLDAFIQGFHQALGMGQGGREEYPHDTTAIHIDPSGSQPGVDLGAADLQGPTTTHGRLTVQRTLVHGGEWHPALALALTAQVPLDNQVRYGGNIADVAADLAVAQRLDRWYGYVTGTYARFGSNRINGVHLHRSNVSGLAAMECRLTPGWSLTLQYLVSQGIAPDYYVFSKASHELTAGTKVVISHQLTLDFGLIENLVIFANSPDFGLHLAVVPRQVV